MASCFSRSISCHGGSCILVETGVDFIELTDLKQKSIELILECSAVKLTKLKIVLISIYSPPNKTQVDSERFFVLLQSILSDIPTKYKVLISGDFNIDLNINSKETIRLTDLFRTYNFVPTIINPTRVTATTKTTIDNIFVNIQMFESAVIPWHLSDHSILKLSIDMDSTEKNESKYVEKRIYNKERLDAINEGLRDESWGQVLSSVDIDEGCGVFIDIVRINIDNVAKKRIVKLRPSKNKPWLTDKIKTMSLIKRQMYEGVLHNNFDENTYKRFCKVLKEEISNAKRNVYTE